MGQPEPGCQTSRSSRHVFVDRQTRRERSPRGSIAREDRNGRAEGRRVVQGPRVNRMRVIHADNPAEHKPATNGTGVAHRLATAAGFRPVLQRLTAEAQCGSGKAHERDEARTRGLAAIDTITIARYKRLAFSFIAQRATQTATGDHRPIVTPPAECSPGDSMPELVDFGAAPCGY